MTKIPTSVERFAGVDLALERLRSGGRFVLHVDGRDAFPNRSF